MSIFFSSPFLLGLNARNLRIVLDLFIVLGGLDSMENRLSFVGVARNGGIHHFLGKLISTTGISPRYNGYQHLTNMDLT